MFLLPLLPDLSSLTFFYTLNHSHHPISPNKDLWCIWVVLWVLYNMLLFLLIHTSCRSESSYLCLVLYRQKVSWVVVGDIAIIATSSRVQIETLKVDLELTVELDKWHIEDWTWTRSLSIISLLESRIEEVNLSWIYVKDENKNILQNCQQK